MKKYLVIKVIKDLTEFDRQVNEKIAQGYEPLGGVSLHTDVTSRNDEFCQAMLFKAEPPETQV